MDDKLSQSSSACLPAVASDADGTRHVSVAWLAHYWSVHPNTVYRDINKRALRAFRLPGGAFRVKLSDAMRYGRPNE
jgi:hypothetical protein